MGIKFEIIFPPLGFLEGRPKEKKIVFYASLPCQRRTKKSHMSYFFVLPLYTGYVPSRIPRIIFDCGVVLQR